MQPGIQELIKCLGTAEFIKNVHGKYMKLGLSRYHLWSFCPWMPMKRNVMPADRFNILITMRISWPYGHYYSPLFHLHTWYNTFRHHNQVFLILYPVFALYFHFLFLTVCSCLLKLPVIWERLFTYSIFVETDGAYTYSDQLHYGTNKLFSLSMMSQHAEIWLVKIKTDFLTHSLHLYLNHFITVNSSSHSLNLFLNH